MVVVVVVDILWPLKIVREETSLVLRKLKKSVNAYILIPAFYILNVHLSHCTASYFSFTCKAFVVVLLYVWLPVFMLYVHFKCFVLLQNGH